MPANVFMKSKFISKQHLVYQVVLERRIPLPMTSGVRIGMLASCVMLRKANTAFSVETASGVSTASQPLARVLVYCMCIVLYRYIFTHVLPTYCIETNNILASQVIMG